MIPSLSNINHSSHGKLNQTALFSTLNNIILPCTISPSTTVDCYCCSSQQTCELRERKTELWQLHMLMTYWLMAKLAVICRQKEEKANGHSMSTSLAKEILLCNDKKLWKLTFLYQCAFDWILFIKTWEKVLWHNLKNIFNPHGSGTWFSKWKSLWQIKGLDLRTNCQIFPHYLKTIPVTSGFNFTKTR